MSILNLLKNNLSFQNSKRKINHKIAKNALEDGALVNMKAFLKLSRALEKIEKKLRN